MSLDEIRARLDAATPGPWEVYDPNEGSGISPLWAVANDAFHNPPADDDAPWIAVDVHVGGREDAEFIAHAPQDIAALLAVAEAARHVPVEHESFCRSWLPPHTACNCAVRDLRAALAALDPTTERGA